MPNTADAFISLLATQVGYHEGKDANGDWNNMTKYGAWYGMNGVAWCDIFQSWGGYFSGNGDIIPKSAYVPGRLELMRSQGLTGHYPPQRGDLGFVMYNGEADHIFAVEKFYPGWTTGNVQSLEGNSNDNGSNQGDGVYRLNRTDSANGTEYIYGRPAFAAPTNGPTDAQKAALLPGAHYTGSNVVNLANVTVDATNADVTKFDGLLWQWICRYSPRYALDNIVLWDSEPAAHYGEQSQRATQQAYLILSTVYHKPDVQPVTLPTWPGKDILKYLSGVSA